MIRWEWLSTAAGWGFGVGVLVGTFVYRWSLLREARALKLMQDRTVVVSPEPWIDPRMAPHCGACKKQMKWLCTGDRHGYWPACDCRDRAVREEGNG